MNSRKYMWLPESQPPMPSRTRRSVLTSILPGLVLVGTGCLGENSQTDETTSPSESGSTKSPSESGLTIETTIKLVLSSESVIDEEPIQPLVFEELPQNEREILQTAHDQQKYSVSYEKHEGIPDNEKTDGLQRLIDRILDRLSSQKETYREEHDTDSVPEHVDAVYLRYSGEIYCIDLVDGDKKHYHC